MREGWVYKKLGEVAKISSGKAIPSSDIIDTFSEGLYPCYGGNGLRGYVDHFSNDGLVPVIGRVGALCGNVHLPQGKFYATEHALVVYLKTKDKPHYIEYLLSSLNLRQYAKGVAQPVLSASTLSEITIPVPPLSEQQRIVSELDLLSSIIEKKKAQLKEYDQLTQSIFYHMFGDPITNEKGWEVKKLGEVYKLKSGDGLSAKQFVDGQYPVYGGNGISGYHKAYNMDGNYIIVGRVGAYCGNVRNVIGKFWLTDNAFQLIYDIEQQHPVFVKYVLTYLDLHQYANHAAQPVISNTTLKDIKVVFPPLSLQQSFAEKIEAIEKQKSLVQQSIVETQTMFDYTMDKYFG